MIVDFRQVAIREIIMFFNSPEGREVLFIIVLFIAIIYISFGLLELKKKNKI